MTKRPVFKINAHSPFFKESNIEFQFLSGYGMSEQIKSMKNLHQAYHRRFPEDRILEVSTRSETPLGTQLSAFNLLFRHQALTHPIPVENVFQSGKVFEYGGPYTDLLEKTPREAKKDSRLRSSGNLKEFRLMGESFPLEPKTFFYDWIYINALHQNPELAGQLKEYQAFTDIAFNPAGSINCQARSCAIYVSLCLSGQLEQALHSRNNFLAIVYGRQDKPEIAEYQEDQGKQLSFDDM